MRKCTFFGHRDAPDNVGLQLSENLRNIIVHENVNIFYVGDNGRFDKMVQMVLANLKKEGYDIEFFVVLAYMPKIKSVINCETIYPEGLETVLPKYAIDRRNRWMIEHSDYAIVYVERSFGGAAKYVEIAKKKGLKVINIAK